MEGSYTFQSPDGARFDAGIPRFELDGRELEAEQER
jgi:uncharacterized protein affecting Mg2+/Co2+ transport